MNEPFVARERECGELQKRLDSGRSEFVIVYGRRRVGKTFLIDNFFKGTFDFKFVGTRGANTRTQLLNFTNTINRYSKKKFKRFTLWEDAFFALEQYLESLPKEKKKIVFFDEMPWIDTQRSNFVRSLEYFWNSWAISQHNILLIATGSATSWMMDKLVANKGGLHGRITSRLHVAPFTLHEVETYLRQIGCEWDRYQIMQSYMVLGGVPFYYSLLDPKQSLAQNIDSLFFHDDGPLKLEFEELYHALFKNADLYLSVVKALCNHKAGFSNQEISRLLKVEGGKLTKVLKNLERCDFIERWNKYGNKKREEQFRIVDFYTLFYYKFVNDNNFKDPYWWSNHADSSGISAWMGLSFELICMRHHLEIKRALDIESKGPQITTWKQVADSDKGKLGAQVDMVIERNDRIIHLCEMKFSTDKFTITRKYEDDLRERRTIFKEATSTTKTLVYTFITTYGIVGGKHNSIVHSEVTMDQLFDA